MKYKIIEMEENNIKKICVNEVVKRYIKKRRWNEEFIRLAITI